MSQLSQTGRARTQLHVHHLHADSRVAVTSILSFTQEDLLLNTGLIHLSFGILKV